MEKVLLVEPDYKNKYPPIGLMKLATYHKSKGDKVEFYKGQAPYTLISKMDRVYITTLFTFYYDITLSTIKHYVNYLGKQQVYVGGIAATLLQEKFLKDANIEQVIAGQLINSAMLGYNDGVNIDALPLDYDILDDISYKYPAGDNFFIYTTRGCPRNCEFCAVSKLEPEFKDTNNIITQIESIREKYGDKRNVLIMDNNILFSEKLNKIASDLEELGFHRDNCSFVYPNPFDIMVGKIQRRIAVSNGYAKQEEELLLFLIDFSKKIKAKKLLEQYNIILAEVGATENKYEVILQYQSVLREIVEKYRYKKPLPRYVDFNQGVDARLLTNEKMRLLSNVSINPFRLAYDHISQTKTYVNAVQTAYNHGVRHFSNYLLYNYEDDPKDLWQRLYNNICLYEEKPDVKGFSFPMKYAPIDRIDREYIGEKWNKKFLSALNVILNVTQGVVAKERDFFYKAYGKTENEFIMILFMPNEFIKYRLFFEGKGYIQKWSNIYESLSELERDNLKCLLCGETEQINSDQILEIMPYYKITKHAASIK